MAINRAIFGGVAVFLGLLGNVMGKVRRNFRIGIRVPWALANERAWYCTYRFAAKVIVFAVALSLIDVLAGAPLWLCLTVLLTGPIVPVFYSLVIYKRFERSGTLEA